MKKLLNTASLLAFALLLCIPFAATAEAGPIAFAVSGDSVAIGASDAGNASTYGGGFHNIVAVNCIDYQGTAYNEVYGSFSAVADGAREAVVAFSYDGGLSWEKTILAKGPGVGTEAPAIAVDPECNFIHAIWSDGQTLYYSRSYVAWGDRLQWSTPIAVNGGFSFHREEIDIAADTTGGVHIVFSGSGLRYSRSADFGNSFTDLGTPVTGLHTAEPSIGVDGSGVPYVAVFAQDYPNPNHIYLFKRESGTGQWVTLSSNVEGNAAPREIVSLAVKDSTTLYVAWNGQLQDGLQVAASVDGGSSWKQYPVEARPDKIGYYAGIAVDANGVLNLVWDGNPTQTGMPASVYFSRSVNGGAKWTSPLLISENADFPNIAVDTNGKVHIMFEYYDAYRNRIKYTREK